MKRPSSSDLPAPLRSSPRRRTLSEEERQLWDSVARHATPLRKHSRAVKATAVCASEPPLPSPAAGHKGQAAPAAESAAPVKSGRAPAQPPLAPLGRRQRSQLSRGKTAIDARLDLHGMTQTRAHRALLRFLQRASGDGSRFVLVITGKGGGSGPQAGCGVLRRQVPEWLSLPEFRKLVVGFEEAHRSHGGGGALYVRVRCPR